MLDMRGNLLSRPAAPPTPTSRNPPRRPSNTARRSRATCSPRSTDARASAGAGQIPRGRLGGLRFHQRRAERRDSRPDQIRDDDVAEDGGEHRLESAAGELREPRPTCRGPPAPSPGTAGVACRGRPRTSPIKPAALVRHVRFPKAQIKRISLSVLVDQGRQMGRHGREGRSDVLTAAVAGTAEGDSRMVAGSPASIRSAAIRSWSRRCRSNRH